MTNNNQLQIPNAALQDKNSLEVIRVWIADKQQHVSLRTSVWEDPAAYGVLVCDLMKHITNAYHQNEGKDWQEAFARVKAGFDAEFSAATDRPQGR